MSSEQWCGRWLALSLGLFCTAAWGGVTTEVTRIIVQAPQHESTVQVANLNDYPVIVQAWVDDGALVSGPENTTAPIIALPAVFRLQPDGQRNLRMIYSGDALPQDRESLFWLNIYEIPPEPQVRTEDYLTVTMRTQTKVFYRPEDLPTEPYQAPEQLGFTLAQQAGKTCLQVNNGSPYHLTFSGLKLEAGAYSQEIKGDMVMPFSRLCLALERPLEGEQAAAGVSYTLLDDLGNPQEHKAPLGR